MSGLQEFRRRPARLGPPTVRVLMVLGRIALAATIGYLAAFLVAAFTPLGPLCFFLIGPFAAAMALLLADGRPGASR